jgi:hypothetical protein
MSAWKYQIYFMFNTRNKSGISAHPCIILYIYMQGVYKIAQFENIR